MLDDLLEVQRVAFRARTHQIANLHLRFPFAEQILNELIDLVVLEAIEVNLCEAMREIRLGRDLQLP